MTYRQVSRSVVRTMRAMDRQAKRTERQRVAQQSARNKQAVLDSSAQAAAEYDATITALTGSHRIAFVRREWFALAALPLVAAPERSDAAERGALASLDAYEPGWFANNFKLAERKRMKLTAAIDNARDRDEQDHQNALSVAEATNARLKFARKLVAGDHDAIVTALDDYSTLADLPFAVENVDILFIDDRTIVMVDGLDLEDMPEQTITLLQSGKASIKTMTAGKRIELHRDAICSAALRVASETLIALPLSEIEVVVQTDVLDRGSGHIENAPVLYLRVTAQALAAVNLQRADPVALAERLDGKFDWHRRDGFRPLSLEPFAIFAGIGVED